MAEGLSDRTGGDGDALQYALGALRTIAASAHDASAKQLAAVAQAGIDLAGRGPRQCAEMRGDATPTCDGAEEALEQDIKLIGTALSMSDHPGGVTQAFYRVAAAVRATSPGTGRPSPALQQRGWTVSGSDYDDFDDDECQHCGGEGRVAGTCIDGCCAEQDDPYCEYCSRRCEFCNPAPSKSTHDLRQVLADALFATTDASTKGDGK